MTQLKISRTRVWFVLALLLSLCTIPMLFGYNFVLLNVHIITIDILFLVLWGLFGRCPIQFLSSKIASVTFIYAFIVFIAMLANVIPAYESVREPETGRTFVIAYTQAMNQRRDVTLYERKGPFIKTTGHSYSGELAFYNPFQAYIDDAKENIIVSFFFLGPVFAVPLD